MIRETVLRIALILQADGYLYQSIINLSIYLFIYCFIMAISESFTFIAIF